MNCNLGDFRTVDWQTIAWIHARVGQQTSDAFQRWAHAQPPRDRPTDILDALGPGHRDHSWLRSVHETLLEIAPAQTRLEICEFEPEGDDTPCGGYTAVAARLVASNAAPAVMPVRTLRRERWYEAARAVTRAFFFSTMVPSPTFGLSIEYRQMCRSRLTDPRGPGTEIG